MSTLTVPGTLERAALDFANGLRQQAGDEPVEDLESGGLNDAASCPIARTAGAGWTVSSALAVCSRGRTLLTAVPPPAVEQFINQFDAGEFPHLIERVPQIGGWSK